MFIEPVTGVRTFVVPFRTLQTSGAVLLLALAIVKNKRFHAVASILIATLIPIAITLTRYRLGQLEASV